MPSEVKKNKNLDLAISQIERQFGKGSIMKMSEGHIMSLDSISTGSLSLDSALGIGGAWRCLEMFGDA